MPTLSVAIIAFNEEANLRRTLASVRWADEIVIVDSHSRDRTVETAREFGAKVYVEDWKGFAAQKNSALEKCSSDFILSLDADEEVSLELVAEVREFLAQAKYSCARIPRRNMFMGRWMQRGGFYPDRKLRLFKRGAGKFAERAVHEDLVIEGAAECSELRHDLIHHAYPTLAGYIEHMNRYSSLGTEMVIERRGRVGFSVVNIVIRPLATFIYNYILRGGFLDGREGLLLHLYHSVYVSWKYAKAWERGRVSE